MSSKKTTKTSNTPWAPAEPYITDGLSQLQAANHAGQAQLDATMPGINAEITRLSTQAANPPAYLKDARDQLDKTIRGDYISANPHTGGLADLIAQKTGAQYNSTFGASGRAHGGLSALLSGQGVGDALQQFYSNQYNTERGLQQQAMLAAPGFNQDEYTALNNLLPAVSTSALLPGQVAANYSNAVTNATSPYVQTKTTQKTGGLGSVLATGLGLATQIAGAIGTGGASLGAGGPTSAMGPVGMSGLISSTPLSPPSPFGFDAPPFGLRYG